MGRYLAMLLVLLLAGGAIAWVLWPPAVPKTVAPPPPRIEVAGQPLGLDGDPVADALDLVRRYAHREFELAMPDGTTHRLRPASLGVEIDRARVGQFVVAATSSASPIVRAYRKRAARDGSAVIAVPPALSVDGARSIEVLVALKDQIDRAASDAFVDLQRRELRAEKYGFRLDVYATLARIEAALRRGAKRVDAVVEKIAPRVTASQLGNVKFDAVLGYFETRYSRSRRNRARTYNLRLAASRLDGTVMLPGELFDFNKVVGPRDEASGYKVAPVIAQGELVDGIGGGTCQISGTLHGAAFFSGLEVAERAPHTRPSSYIKLGLDAAVAYPAINFKLRNNFPFAVVLHQTVKDGVVKAAILGPKRKRTVSFFRRIDETLPFEQEERETERLPKGERVLSQRGVPGFKTMVIRVVREGAYAIRTKTRNHYPATTQIVKVGTGPKASAKKKLKQDRSLEYVADEYLVVTQGPGIRSPTADKPELGGGTVESRTPGRTGRRGWQKKAGMPVFEPPDESDDK